MDALLCILQGKQPTNAVKLNIHSINTVIGYAELALLGSRLVPESPHEYSKSNLSGDPGIRRDDKRKKRFLKLTTLKLPTGGSSLRFRCLACRRR
jgi:hypothetical protein